MLERQRGGNLAHVDGAAEVPRLERRGGGCGVGRMGRVLESGSGSAASPGLASGAWCNAKHSNQREMAAQAPPRYSAYCSAQR